MKHFLKLLVGLIISVPLHSQTYFEISDPHNGGQVVNGTYLESQGNPGSAGGVGELYVDLVVKNITGSAIQTSLTRTEVDVVDSTKNSTCWGFCPIFQYAGTSVVWNHPFTVNIAAGDSNSSFSAHHQPEGRDGCSLYKYEFYNEANPSEMEFVYIKFFHNSGSVDCSTLDVIENNPNLNKVTMYPNPAVNNLKVNIENNVSVTSLVIVDMLGKTVKTVNTTNKNGVSNIDVSNLNQGFYFLKVMDGSKILQSKKLVINK